MKIALDTNILVCAEGVHGNARRERALSLLENLPRDSVVLPAQVLGELFQVLTKKARLARKAARAAVYGWLDVFKPIDTSTTAMAAAIDLATKHQIALWDALVISVSANAGCRLLLSEDMQDGFTWAAVTVANPFAPRQHEFLAALLNRSSGLD